MRSISLVMVLGTVVFSSAMAQGKHEALYKCYQEHGQLESVQTGNKRVTTYRNQMEVAADCNKKVIAKAKGEKNVETLNELALIIGRRSNWQSAIPVYTEGAKSAKAACQQKDALYAADLALSSPKGHAHSNNALAFYDACWPANKEVVVALLKDDADSYHKEHLCGFLKSKQALPSDKEKLCKS